MKIIQWPVSAVKKVSYPIFVGSNAIEHLPAYIQKLPKVDDCIVLYDIGVKKVAEKIMQIVNCPGIAVPGGEHSKSLQQVERITQDMILKGATKNTIVIAVGGGMACDLGNFIASVFKRGIRSILVPTTIVAMADAAVSGKTTINIGQVKNVLGTWHYPNAVIVDTTVLTTIPDQGIADGLTEIIKLAAMANAEFFGWIEENIDRLLQRELTALNKCLEKSILLLKEVHSNEAFTQPELSASYFGHTIGHCVESLSNFSLSHGQAVSIGMCTEMRICQTKDQERIQMLLQKIEQPIHIPIEIRTQAIWELLQSNHKDECICAPKTIGDYSCQTINFTQLSNARE